MSRSGSFSDIKSLARKSVVYGFGSMLLKAIGFLLIPVYTRHLTSADFGTVALAGSLTAVLSILFALELRGAINYFYYQPGSPEERLSRNGTIWLAMVGLALILALVADRLGQPLFALVFQSVPFDPYVRLVIWTTFFAVLGQFPQLIFQVREKPLPYVALLVSNAVLTIGLVIYFVVYRGLGAYGYLLGLFFAGALMSLPYLLVALRNLRLTMQWGLLIPILLYSLPLVPHSLSSWLLELSDRFILEKFVPLAEIGIYSLGYQFGSIVNLVASAMNTAWVPFVFRILEQTPQEAAARISRLSTYFVLVLTLVFLGVGLYVREVNLLVTSDAFYPAYRVAYWVALGQLLQGLYYIPVNFLFLRNQTSYIPIITISSAVVDIILNLLLLPHYGMIAAAWAGLVSKMVMLVCVLWISRRVYPIQYENARLGKLLGLALVVFGAGLLVPQVSLPLGFALKTGILSIFPAGLLAFGFFQPEELQAIRAGLARIAGKGGPA